MLFSCSVLYRAALSEAFSDSFRSGILRSWGYRRAEDWALCSF
jgi:hypothetical protein